MVMRDTIIPDMTMPDMIMADMIMADRGTALLFPEATSRGW